ncbi:hypothetical protein JM654_23480 [Microbacterium oxydans]|nr:hypothetical protein [Microbacterium oxydans]
MTETGQFGRTTLPPKQQRAIRSAGDGKIFTIVYVDHDRRHRSRGRESQAMRTAWIEALLSLIPQIAFPHGSAPRAASTDKETPARLHRAMGVGHLVAGVALLAVGLNSPSVAITGLVAAEHPTIGTVQLFGQTVIWLRLAHGRRDGRRHHRPVFVYGPASRSSPPCCTTNSLRRRRHGEGRLTDHGGIDRRGARRGCRALVAGRRGGALHLAPGSSGTASATQGRPWSI